MLVKYFITYYVPFSLRESEIHNRVQGFLCFLFFWPRQAACGILVPRPGIKPVPPALGARSLNHWTAREVPNRVQVLDLVVSYHHIQIAKHTVLNARQCRTGMVNTSTPAVSDARSRATV